MRQVLMLLLVTVINPIWADEGVDITDQKQISALDLVQTRLDSVSTAMMGCMDTGYSHPACLCKYQNLIIQFNSSVKDLFLNHPDLEQLDLVRFKSSNGIWVSQSLKGMKKQAETTTSCE